MVLVISRKKYEHNEKYAVTNQFDVGAAWENLALIMEGLGVTAQKCIKEGISKGKVYGQIKKYVVDVLSSYEVR